MAAITAYLMLGGLAGAAAGRVLWRPRRRWRMVAAAGVWLPGALLLAGAGYSCWYHHRRPPAPLRRELFRGVTYSREVLRRPRPMVVHVVQIDLDDPDIGFVVTPPSPTDGRRVAARTTSQFLETTGAAVAINGGGFSPWYAHGPLWYYPHAGDGVDPSGLVISRGRSYSRDRPGRPAICITRDNRVSLGGPATDAYNAVAGFCMVLKDGRPAPGSDEREDSPQPRTAAALDAAGRRLMLFVIDGRQPNYSEGATLAELAEIIAARGGRTALNLDGGGSSTLVARGPEGRAVVLNSPIHGRVPPGRERPVATHLGVYAARRRIPTYVGTAVAPGTGALGGGSPRP